MEAVHGAEQLPQPTDNPVHPFARNVVGSMDYTPVSLEVGPRGSSVAHEVALPVLFESGWQHFADKPEAYQRFPRALRFLNQVPTVWQETRFRGGYPGQDAVLARRGGDRWFFDGIATGPATTLTAALDVLGPGRWLVEVIRDAPGERADVLVESSVRTAGERLSVDVPANGGFAAIACRATAGRTSCHQPVPQPPVTKLAVTPGDAGDLVAGNSFEVTAEFTGDSARTLRGVEPRPSAPAGWQVSGAAITAARLAPGGQLRGRWQVTVGPDAKFGPVEVPVVAEFTDAALPQGRRRMRVEQAVKATVALTGSRG
ncbi:glycoside hydrolase family 97 C-terminal domain-containing protein [Crossiella sp. NPDC003009]